jgi:quercetin dioxygenase-like cupin family protein
MRRSWLFAPLAFVASFALVGTVLANHLPTNHNITIVTARGTIMDSFKYNVGDIKVQTKGPVDIVVADVSFPVLASAGWHNHPGPVFVVVKSGTLSVWGPDCVKHQYSQGGPEGASFFEAGQVTSLLVKNESATIAVEVKATFIVPPDTTALRFGTAHLCGLEE